ncbi:hypothetical protein NIES25_55770 (plasmid) [Nostoc linckia NIES-25]|nr:hypothetical protein NIES25_55770 [Nostoc linckia NIES-25]
MVSERNGYEIKSLPTDGVVDPLPQDIVVQLSQQAVKAKK